MKENFDLCKDEITALKTFQTARWSCTFFWRHYDLHCSSSSYFVLHIKCLHLACFTNRVHSIELTYLQWCKYSNHILKYHENFISKLRTHMTAKVKVVWGSYICKRMLKTLNLEPIQLWDKCWDCVLHLKWDNVQQNERAIWMLKYIIVFVMHSQIFLYSFRKKHTVIQNLWISVAAKLVKVEIQKRFFQ